MLQPHNFLVRLLVPALFVALSLHSRFEAIAQPIIEGQLRIAFGSCIKNPDTLIWNAIRQVSPDVMLFLGDNLYFTDSDLDSPAKMEKRYRELFGKSSFLKLLNNVPFAAIWDDHDFGPNDSDSSFEGSVVSRKLFQKHWSGGLGARVFDNSVASAFNMKGVRILLTDNRSFRINPGKENSQMFGDKQLAWIERELQKPKSPLIILASGNQILSDMEGNEGLYQYPGEYKRVIAALENTPAAVIIISGDIHFSEIYQAELNQKKVIEVTSSPLSAPPARAINLSQDTNRISYAFGSHNFGLLELIVGDSPSSRQHLIVSIFDSELMPLIKYHSTI